ncbi:MAG: FAD:protein FMN transferase [Reyranella sp.]
MASGAAATLVGLVFVCLLAQITSACAAGDRAVSTSGGYGFRFDSDGRFNHLFDPVTGGSAHLYRGVTTVCTENLSSGVLVVKSAKDGV